jgi:hypothetical protein
MVGDMIGVEKRGGIWGGLGLCERAGSSKTSGGKGKFEGTFSMGGKDKTELCSVSDYFFLHIMREQLSVNLQHLHK